jgi:hypothetical protein
MDDRYSPRGQSLLSLRLVELDQMWGCQLLESDSSYGGDQVTAHYDLVPVDRGRLAGKLGVL